MAHPQAGITYAVCMGKGIVLLVASALALIGAPAAALGASGNVASTEKYIQANFALVQTGTSKLGAARVAITAARRRIEGECSNAAARSPQNPESTELSNEIIGAIVLTAMHIDVPAGTRFIRAAGGLHWSNGKLTSAIRSYVGKLKVLSTLQPPNVCADVRAWVSSGYSTLTTSTIRFDKQFMPNWVALGETPTSLLSPFAGSAQKSLLRRTGQLESQLTEFEAIDGVNTWDSIMEALGLSP